MKKAKVYKVENEAISSKIIYEAVNDKIHKYHIKKKKLNMLKWRYFAQYLQYI